MHALTTSANPGDDVAQRTTAIFREQMDANNRRTDRMFAWLMAFQWIAGVAAAIWISPRGWEGQNSQIHIHVWAAIFLGGMISGFPIFLAMTRPGSTLTRHVMAVGQMLSCSLLIHFTGGRIETHFQYFGALAFLSFYRDWRVLLTASVVAAADHFIGGIFWPQSMYGVLVASAWRSAEHTGWILFEDVFLVLAIRQNLQVIFVGAERQANLEALNQNIEEKVQERTSQLRKEATERQQVEEILRDSERKFRQLAENITDVFWMLSPDMGKIEYISPAYDMIWGRSVEPLYTNPMEWFESVFPEDRERITAVFTKLAQGESSVSTEYRIIRPDGSLRWIHTRGYQVRNAEGTVIRLTGISTDITDRKQAGRELEENRQLLDGIMKNSVDGIVAYEAIRDEQGELMDFRFLLVNPAAERLIGKSESELLWHGLLEASPEIVMDGLFESCVRLVETGETLDFEYSSVRSNSLRWYRVAGVKLGDGLVMSYSDITERKMVQDQLDRLRKDHQAVLNSVTEGVHWVAEDGTIKFENLSAVSMLGYEVSELIGKPAHQTMHHHRNDGTEYPVGECPIYATLHDGVGRHVKEEVFWRKDGTSFPVEYTATPVRNEAGDLNGAVVVFTNITERKSIEARLLQSQKMETVGKLAGGVAHEFNSILTAIIGQSELLIEELPSEGSLGKSAREIRLAADRAATLTRQLLAYGRKQILQPEILDVNRVLSDMLGSLQHLLGRDVDVRVIPAFGLHKVKIDPGQMDQVILSIAMNAVDAMPNGGKLTLETSDVTLDEDYVHPFPGLKPGGYVMLAISDTGMGMTDEVKARAFEPFFSTKGVGQGTGLGLATCYGIVKQSEGHITVYSEVARGTTFRIYLPQVELLIKSAKLSSNSPDLPRGTETILLAEDDPSLLEMAASLLRRLGYTVFTAVDGIEAMSVKNKKNIGHIDLLFTDVVMPHMSGKELSDRIRASYPHTKILFTSAYTENAIVQQGILNEGVMLLQKPFTPTALAHKVREVLDQPVPS
jgi:two-component system cell cycle sensor histidine kinase/response regulator CckA